MTRPAGISLGTRTHKSFQGTGKLADSASSATAPTQSHAFYMAITAAIMALTDRIRREAPVSLRYAGLDLSHAFETSLYYAAAQDAGLLRLFADPQDGNAAGLLRTPQARLVAEHFAQGPVLDAVRRKGAVMDLARRIKWALPLGPRPLPLPLPSGATPSSPILFLARSLRFARFLRPLVETLQGAAGFLVPDEDDALVSELRSWGIACHSYRVHVRPRGQAGALIISHGRYLAGLADSFGAALAGLSPRLVVVPEGNAPEDDVLARVAERLGVASACIQQGWSPILHPGFRNLRYDAMLVWGEGFGQLLAPVNPEQRFVAAGNFHLADGSPGTGEGILFLFQGFDNWMGGRKSADDMVALAEAAAAALPARPIFIRPHPAVPLPQDVQARLGRFANVRIEPAAEVPLAHAFAKSRISVSAYSSAILESVAAGVTPLVFNTVGLPRYWPDVEAAGVGIEVQDKESALRMLAGEEGGPARRQAMDAFNSRFFKARGATALAESRALLLDLAQLA